MTRRDFFRGLLRLPIVVAVIAMLPKTPVRVTWMKLRFSELPMGAVDWTGGNAHLNGTAWAEGEWLTQEDLNPDFSNIDYKEFGRSVIIPREVFDDGPLRARR